MRLERFSLEGTTYYQEYRRCGKPNCRVCRNGRGHGPYWYSRDAYGKRRYIGKQLPEEVTERWQAYKAARAKMLADRERLRRELAALERLINMWPLGNEDKAVLYGMGYGSCVAAGQSVTTR